LFLQSVWYIKNKKGESQGRGKILTKYYSMRRQLIKAGLLAIKSTIPTTTIVTKSKFCLEKFKYVAKKHEFREIFILVIYVRLCLYIVLCIYMHIYVSIQ